MPILNEAEAYYDRKDYMDDKMAGGKDLHAVGAGGTALLTARERTESASGAAQGADGYAGAGASRKDRRQEREVAHRRVMMATKKAVDLMPTNPRQPGDLKPFDAAITELAAATASSTRRYGRAASQARSTSQPRDILGSLREIRGR